MRVSKLWASTILALAGSAFLSGAQEPSFELYFAHPERINAIKAWGGRICAFEFDAYRLRCFDRGGSLTLDLDIRDRLQGGVTSLTKIEDYTILDDGGVAVVGNWFDPSDPTAEVSAYLLVLDRRGDRVALHRLGDLEPRALGGSSPETLEVLALDSQLALSCNSASSLTSRQDRTPPAAFLHSISPTGEVLDNRFLFNAPSDVDGLSRLRSALSRGIAIDGVGNRYFWVSDTEIVVAPATGERKSVLLPPDPGVFRLPYRLLSRHGTGSLALFFEGANQATAAEAALGFFELSDPEMRVYAIDPAGRAEELTVPDATEIVGELSDGTLVGLNGTGRGRSSVLFLDSIAQLKRRTVKPRGRNRGAARR